MAWPAAGSPEGAGAVRSAPGTGRRVLRWVLLVAAGGIVVACLVGLVAAWLAPDPPIRGWVSTALVIALFVSVPVQIADRVDRFFASRTSSPVSEPVHAPLTGWRRSLDRTANRTAMVFFALVFVVSFLAAFGVVDRPAERPTGATAAPVHRDGASARDRAADDGDGVAIADLSDPEQRAVVAFAASCLLALNSRAFLSRTRGVG